ncbi:MAG: hypothetical protein AABX85_04840 [Nanoarchaeota archaeon]
MKNRMIITICIVVLVLILVLVMMFSGKNQFTNYNGIINESSENSSYVNAYCTNDADCVPASCCHSKSCVVKSGAPDCKRIFCTQECSANTLDCGQGSCACVNNKCLAVFK